MGAWPSPLAQRTRYQRAHGVNRRTLHAADTHAPWAARLAMGAAMPAADEPGGWELKRALADLKTDVRDGNQAIRDELAKLVTTAAHDADMRRLGDQIIALREDLVAEKQARVEAVAHERETRTIETNNEVTARKDAVRVLQQQMDRTATWVRWVAASVLVPVVLFIANLINSRGSS